MKDLSKRYLVTPEEYQPIKSSSSRFDSKPYFIPHPDAKNAAKKHSDLKIFYLLTTSWTLTKFTVHSRSTAIFIRSKNAVSVPKSYSSIRKTIQESTTNSSSTIITSTKPIGRYLQPRRFQYSNSHSIII